MARKPKKRRKQMPPLFFVDQVIYWAILLLLIAVYFLLALGPLLLKDRIAFADDAVIAANTDKANTLWHLIPWMTFFLMTFIPWLDWYQGRRPIFGRRDFKYGPPAWPKVYPLFMKNKPPVFVSERQKRNRRQLAAALLVVLLVSFIPFPWALYGRDCLQSDGSIVQYNIFNGQTREFSPEEIEELEIETYRYTTGKRFKTSHWSVRMIFRTESGSEYIFAYQDFRMDTPSRFADMLDIKSRYAPDVIHYDGMEDLGLVVEKMNLSEEEARLLYRLFGQ